MKHLRSERATKGSTARSQNVADAMVGALISLDLLAAKLGSTQRSRCSQDQPDPGKARSEDTGTSPWRPAFGGLR